MREEARVGECTERMPRWKQDYIYSVHFGRAQPYPRQVVPCLRFDEAGRKYPLINYLSLISFVRVLTQFAQALIIYRAHSVGCSLRETIRQAGCRLLLFGI